MAVDDDLLAQLVQFLSSTESRNKVYRLIQYSAKLSKWTLMTMWRLRPEDLRELAHVPEHKPPNAVNGHTHKASTAEKESSTKTAVRRVAAMLSRVEGLFADGRKVYRLLQFLEMLDMLRHVHEPEAAVRVLRRLRIVCFFFFNLLENYMMILLRIKLLPHRDPRVVFLKRACNGFWCLSIVLAFPLDHLMHRNSHLSTIKKLLDLPVAYLAFADHRVNDGLFSLLGVASANIGVYLRWIEVVRKMQSKQSSIRAPPIMPALK
ncbi:hypothetical protein Poli38472_003797 [Pythium oligandrum]|uniref:Uncharacterized protein n=1 Tax=Pythium oligandrum TaxID=41045 RepID=A0A8K1FNM6_PYTOL|nr:hypothetical protein Poli38472_003797 [Pythium oligandrum]|eukprot:TMW66032.1 hypothetical protein Poli38472_003797 [Pythium oligandrum]